MKSLEQTNRSLEKTKFFYRNYIKQAEATLGHKKLLEILQCEDKYIYKVINTGSLKQAWKMANKIADTMSANEGTNKLCYRSCKPHSKYKGVTVDYKLRKIPDEQYHKLKEIAKKENRSLNKQILYYLEQAVKADTMSAKDGTKKQ